MSLSLANVKTMMDSLAKQVGLIRESGFNANSTGYTNNRNTIVAADIAAMADLAATFEVDVAPIFGTNFESRFRAMDAHVGGLDAYLQLNDSRVSSFLRDYAGLSLSAKCFFSGHLTAAANATSNATGLYTMSVTGSGVGTFAIVQPIEQLYGKSWLEFQVYNATIGVASITSPTAVGTKQDGTAQSKASATITNGSVVGTKFSIPNAGAIGTDGDHFATVSNITFAGGTNGDKFQINIKTERQATL